MKTGQFAVEVANDGSPCWITIRSENPKGDKIELRFHPDDLPDLKHVLHRADVAARVADIGRNPLDGTRLWDNS